MSPVKLFSKFLPRDDFVVFFFFLKVSISFDVVVLAICA